MSSLKYIKSAVYPEDYPFGDKPEIAIVGRSNAGKSSLINAISNTKLAHVSSSPGKTITLNFFESNEGYFVVDMPGYGYAARPNATTENWKEMIETYLKTRENLVGLILIMDIRREWSDDEDQLMDWLKSYDRNVVVVLNKEDKLSQLQANKKHKDIASAAQISNIMSVSAMKKKGIKELKHFIFKEWLKT